MKIRLVTSLVGLMLISGSHLSAQQAEKSPRVVRLRLADLTLNPKQKDLHKYDSTQKYHLVAGNNFNGDGAGSAFLLLCPNLHRQPDFFYSGSVHGDIRLERTALPRLRTGNGINIGDTPQQVQRKTGAIPGVITYYPKTQMRIYGYETPLTSDSAVLGKRKKVKYVYQANYTFYKERLWSILYSVGYPGT